jgi:hypothetical protein
MIGPGAPVPRPAGSGALVSAEVTSSAADKGAFQLTFSVDANSPLQTLFLLSGGSLPPIMRVILVVTINGAAEVIMDGVITHHEVTPDTENGHATLTGEDLTAVMNWIDSGIPYPAMPPKHAGAIIAKYAFRTCPWSSPAS